MDFNQEVVEYLDKLYIDKKIDMEHILGELRHVFNIPPGRALEIVSRWAKTYTKKHKLMKVRAGIHGITNA